MYFDFEFNSIKKKEGEILLNIIANIIAFFVELQLALFVTQTVHAAPNIENIENKMILPEGFVYLEQACPDIKQDIKYASTDNFTGEMVAGYKAPKAILTLEAASALKAVQAELAQTGYELLIFDAYRPTRAVEAFWHWRHIPDNPVIKLKYHPNLTKQEIYDNGYIMRQNSSHSRGSTVDLTIVDSKTGQELDMGTTFDFFGKESHTDYPEISQQAKNNRALLKDLMTKHGFENLPQEWWHYTLKNEPFKDIYFDFEVE